MLLSCFPILNRVGSHLCQHRCSGCRVHRFKETIDVTRGTLRPQAQYERVNNGSLFRVAKLHSKWPISTLEWDGVVQHQEYGHDQNCWHTESIKVHYSTPQSGNNKHHRNRSNNAVINETYGNNEQNNNLPIQVWTRTLPKCVSNFFSLPDERNALCSKDEEVLICSGQKRGPRRLYPVWRQPYLRFTSYGRGNCNRTFDIS